MDSLRQLVEFLLSLNTEERPIVVHALVFAINLVIIFFSESFLALFNKGKSVSVQARILRAGAIVFLILHIIDVLLVTTFPAYQNYFIRIGLSLATVFGCLLLFNIVSYFSRQKFGYQKTIDNETVYLDSYNSRLLDLFVSVFVILVAVYCVVNIWKLEGLLQTTGLLGIIFGFLALTSSIWAPDIYYGLVILNSNMLEDGDVIKLVGYEDELIISRVSFIYTILLDVRNNHRVLLRNSQLVQNRVDNLSKRASAEGLRHAMEFNIGFPALASKIEEERKNSNGAEQYEAYRGRIKTMFEYAFELVSDNKDAKINHNMPFEVALSQTGDYALTFRLNYYLEALPNTKVTKTIRQYLVRTPNLIQEAVNQAALEYRVSLATPLLVDHRAVST